MEKPLVGALSGSVASAGAESELSSSSGAVSRSDGETGSLDGGGRSVAEEGEEEVEAVG